MSERIYGVATKAWQVVAGCDERMPCAGNCWAKVTVNRLAHAKDAKVREFHSGLVREYHDCEEPECNRKEHKRLHWTGTVRLNEAHLTDPLRWRKPAVIATGYHGDIFRLPPEQIDRVFAVMALCPQHVFLTLTKCAREMEEYLHDRSLFARLVGVQNGPATDGRSYNLVSQARICRSAPTRLRIPLPNVYLGFSASNQAEFDARAPHVLRLAAAGWKTWCSLEPLTGPVDIKAALSDWKIPSCMSGDGPYQGSARLRQVVLGGESGRGARPCDVAWLRSLVAQCKDASVPCFVKQMGSYAVLDPRYDRSISGYSRKLRHPKGADPSEWPEDLRVQELAWEVGR